MSAPSTPLTYEKLLELFRETREQFRETREQFQEEFRLSRETREQFREEFRLSRETREQFREIARRQEENDRRFQEMSRETDRKIRETNQSVGKLGSRVGEIVENMVAGDIVAQFRDLGYKVKGRSQNRVFGEEGTSESGEIDLILEDGDVAILIEAKTTLKEDDVRAHIERLAKYRRYIDSGGSGEKRRYVGAVAGTVVAENVIDFAHENGLYVIIQSARAVEILPQPEGFVAKKW